MEPAGALTVATGSPLPCRFRNPARYPGRSPLLRSLVGDATHSLDRQHNAPEVLCERFSVSKVSEPGTEAIAIDSSGITLHSGRYRIYLSLWTRYEPCATLSARLVSLVFPHPVSLVFSPTLLT